MDGKLGLLLLLSYVNGIGPKRMGQITELVSNTAGLKENFSDITAKVQLNTRAKNNLSKILNNFCVQETILKYKEKGIHIIIKEDYVYPDLLKEIYDPPQILFCKGDLNLLNNPNNISIVGARKSTWYGKSISKDLARYLSEHGYTITSGMAKGIDAQAHLGAMEEKGSSIGVLGCGIDVIYPRENEKIYKQMEEKGLLISAYPLGSSPLAGNFPARNRIISGLSKGVIVIEAQKKSGALITADYAMEQGRDVFAVPGNINSVMSNGTNSLIKDGAIIITKFSDVLEEYDLSSNHMEQPTKVDLSSAEKEILNSSGGQVFSLEHLVLTTGLDMPQILASLMTLEIKGMVKKVGNQLYQSVGKVDF